MCIRGSCQKSRMCMVAGIRDLVLFKDWKLLLGFVTIIVAALIGNLATGNFNLGFSGQPIAHSVHLWNFMGMLVVGLGSVLLGGCPLRQLILTGEGNTDSAVTLALPAPLPPLTASAVLLPLAKLPSSSA